VRYSLRLEGGLCVVRNPAGVVVLRSRRFGSAVWLADYFARRAVVRDRMRYYGEGARFADAV